MSELPARDSKLRLLTILADMARSDEEVDPQERAFLYEFAREHGLAEAEVDAVLARDLPAPDHGPSAAPSDRARVLYSLMSMMQSDGVIAHKEINLLRRQGLRFGVSPASVDDFTYLALTCQQLGLSEQEVLRRITTQMLGS